MNESEDEDESADKVVELSRSPLSLRSPTSPVHFVLSPTQNGDVDEVFLFDDNIPSIATRIPTGAEPADTLALRRRNRLLRRISDSRIYSRDLQRSVSVQLDDRRRQHHHSYDLSDGPSSSAANDRLAEHLLSRLPPPNDGGDDDAEIGGQRQDEREQNLQHRARESRHQFSLANGSGIARRKNSRSLDACCSDISDAVTTKRRGTLIAGMMVVTDGPTSDEENAELSCHLCNGLDDQPTNNSSTSDCSNKAN